MANNIQSIFEYIIKLINSLATLLIGIALVGFLYGILKYFKDAKNPAKLNESKKYMMYRLFSMFVIVSFWGLIILVGNVFGLNMGTSNGDFYNSIDQGDSTDLGATLQPSGSFGSNPNSSDSDVPELDIDSVFDSNNNTPSDNDVDSANMTDQFNNPVEQF